MATINDERSEAQRHTHVWLVIGTDSFMSGWGGAAGGSSYAAWACETQSDAKTVEAWVKGRAEMKRVRVVLDRPAKPYRPGPACAHLTIYPITPEHRALSGE